MINQNPNIDLIKVLYPIPNFDENNLEHLEQLHQDSIQSILNNGGALPIIPPFEKHPYLEPLDVNTTATGLMIGTFPPITYLCDLVKQDRLTFNGKSSRGLKQPPISYFHGNKGTFWDHAPFDFNLIIANKNRNERKQLIKEALSVRQIIYTDVILYCQRELGKTGNGKLKYTANDTDLSNIILNQNVITFLFENNSINRLYFTNSYLFGMSGSFFNKYGKFSLNKNDAFQLFLKSLQQSGVKIEIQIPNSDLGWLLINEDSTMTKERRNNLTQILSSKAMVKLRLTKAEHVRLFDLASSVSPAATVATRTTSQNNPCVKKFSTINKCSIEDSPRLMLNMTLEKFFNNELAQLAQYNA